MLALLVIAFLAGLGWVIALFAPYSAYGRIVQNLLGPVWAAANNLLASAAESADSYAFYRTEVWVRSWPVFTVAVVSLVVLAVLAWRTAVHTATPSAPSAQSSDSSPAFHGCGP